MAALVERAAGVLGADRLRWPIALALAVACWAASLPPNGTGILAVFAFVAPLAVLPEVPLRKLLWQGWLGGAAWEAVTLWWLAPTIVRYGGIGSVTAALLVAALCLILGLYMAGFWWTVWILARRLGNGALVLAPFAWVLWEWLRGWLFGGMPWWGPGYALSLYPSLLQDASWLGVLGLSLLAVLLSAAVALWLRKRRSVEAVVMLPLVLVLFAGAYLWGRGRLERPGERDLLFRVGYLQPNVPQDEKWDRTFANAIEKRLKALSEPFKNYGLKLLVWPESCTPLEWDADQTYKDQVRKIAADVKAPILLGSVLGTSEGYQNGAVVVNPDGTEGGRYAKTHLVPFGEYVPFRGMLSFARPLVEAVGDFAPGKTLKPLEISGAKVGVTICFEGIFPRLVRKEVNQGAQLLVNITNDAWYAGTPGPMEHFLIQRVRAVELDRCLVRSANGGISGLVNNEGRLEMETTPGEAASFWGEARLRNTRTPYARVGDWWLLLPLAAILWSFFVPMGRRSAMGAGLRAER